MAECYRAVVVSKGERAPHSRLVWAQLTGNKPYPVLVVLGGQEFGAGDTIEVGPEIEAAFPVMSALFAADILRPLAGSNQTVNTFSGASPSLAESQELAPVESVPELAVSSEPDAALVIPGDAFVPVAPAESPAAEAGETAVVDDGPVLPPIAVLKRMSKGKLLETLRAAGADVTDEMSKNDLLALVDTGE